LNDCPDGYACANNCCVVKCNAPAGGGLLAGFVNEVASCPAGSACQDLGYSVWGCVPDVQCYPDVNSCDQICPAGCEGTLNSDGSTCWYCDYPEAAAPVGLNKEMVFIG
jgi:hypothetical protein